MGPYVIVLGAVVFGVALMVWLVRRRNERLDRVIPRVAVKAEDWQAVGQDFRSVMPPRPNPSPGMIRPGTKVVRPQRVVREGSSGYSYPDAYAVQPPFFDHSPAPSYDDDSTRRSSMFDGGLSGGGGASSSWDSGSSYDSGSSSCDSGGDSGSSGGCD